MEIFLSRHTRIAADARRTLAPAPRRRALGATALTAQSWAACLACPRAFVTLLRGESLEQQGLSRLPGTYSLHPGGAATSDPSESQQHSLPGRAVLSLPRRVTGRVAADAALRRNGVRALLPASLG